MALIRLSWRLSFTASCLLGGINLAASQEPAENELETIVVTADFRGDTALEMPTSLSIIDAATVQDAGVQHFEELTHLVPNLNWAGGSSRPRYFQLRGIGERSQYEGAPNPSVGFIIDDIDFSGIGMVATLFDVQQIEVLRGPQGTRYGANALAGLINARTKDPGDEFSADVELTAGQDNAQALGVAFGGPLAGSETLGYRIALHKHESDGFRSNDALSRSDTNGRDELTTRAKLRWQAGEHWQVDFTGLYTDLDNGYDAFAIDNGLTTYSDKPGKDAQRSLAGAVRATWQGADAFELVSISTAANSDITFSFDADWGSDDSWDPFTYDFVSWTSRDRQTLSQELRLISAPGAEIFSGTTAWLVGVYALNLRESNTTMDDGLYVDPTFGPFVLDSDLSSDYEATNRAVFGQLDYFPGERTELSIGLRLEHRDADYSDSNGLVSSPGETMLGGHLSFTYQLMSDAFFYASLSRGYKAGGFNISRAVPDDRREFDAEFLWNYEFGFKGLWPNRPITSNISFFYSKREDQQVSTSFQNDPTDPSSFTFFNDNAAKGRNFGLEADLNWMVNDRWQLQGSLGLLDTEFDEFITAERDLSGREQAHAPAYTYALSGRYTHPGGMFARIDITGKDEFFYSDSHDQMSERYKLVNLRLGYEAESWTAYVWGRNVFDEIYTVRGFFFGNEPPDFPNTLYTRQGDPRQFGVTVRYHF